MSRVLAHEITRRSALARGARGRVGPTRGSVGRPFSGLYAAKTGRRPGRKAVMHVEETWSARRAVAARSDAAGAATARARGCGRNSWFSDLMTCVRSEMCNDTRLLVNIGTSDGGLLCESDVCGRTARGECDRGTRPIFPPAAFAVDRVASRAINYITRGDPDPSSRRRDAAVVSSSVFSRWKKK